jgi:hypothetical protein
MVSAPGANSAIRVHVNPKAHNENQALSPFSTSRRRAGDQQRRGPTAQLRAVSRNGSLIIDGRRDDAAPMQDPKRAGASRFDIASAGANDQGHVGQKLGDVARRDRR